MVAPSDAFAALDAPDADLVNPALDGAARDEPKTAAEVLEAVLELLEDGRGARRPGLFRRWMDAENPLDSSLPSGLLLLVVGLPGVPPPRGPFLYQQLHCPIIL